MIIAGIALWLLCGVLGMMDTRRHDGTIPLLIAILFILCGPLTLLVVLGSHLMDINI